ncbi:MAG: restriction endonuclease [Candidatus Woykebacteria bacterium RIFCSPHIGHO2_12_FULL_45_10]|uniref:Restriction endonuclease n=1 Tax=Candidatus Woykebacteria bacterium RIFCSPHIGHO2_12_FULL_45_10 TaxID=1802603 RepID=A0A1G1WP30_9BACT|nr:MAG: restriction endonuclease [Candidatus Woykebacteria bacterium RIFCSPHIGHO2_12_FULL_45_10]
MKQDDFQKSLLRHAGDFARVLATPSGDWSVKGFIDVAKNIYTISVDTKVISKIIELMMFPVLKKFADENQYEMIFSAQQNHYPDVTFIAKDGSKIALDLKSTYRKNHVIVSGFTLGAFTGYFRFRDSNKNITYPYSAYRKHYILGAIYTKQEDLIDENKIYTINDLDNILSVVKDFEFIVQEKYRISKDGPGSGNTKNIGSCIKIDELREGKGPFSALGVKVFDDYWMNYMTLDMARKAELEKPPYANLKQYLSYRNVDAL